MPSWYKCSDSRKNEKAKLVYEDLVKKGLDPRSNKFIKVFHNKMKRY